MCVCILSVVIGRLGKSADSSFQFEPSDYGPKQKLVRFQSKEGVGRGGRWRPVELLEMTKYVQQELPFLNYLSRITRRCQKEFWGQQIIGTHQQPENQ